MNKLAGDQRVSLPARLRDRERVPVQVIPLPRATYWYRLQLPTLPLRPQDTA